MKIAIVAHLFGFRDGQGRVNYEVAKAVLDAGHELTMLGHECADDLATHRRAKFVKFPESSIPTQFMRNWSFAVRSTRWLRKHRNSFDVIQANGFVTFARVDIVAAHFVHGAWLRSPYSIPREKWWSLHALYQRAYTRINSFLEQTAFRRARKIVAVSDNVAEELKSVGVADHRIIVIFNGVDVEEFRPRKQNRSLFQLPEEGTLFLFSGDIRTHRKNLDGVLRAMACVDGLHLAVAGNAGGSPYPALAKELGIADRVHFLGHIAQMSALMATAEAFVFPSRYDPMGLVVLEAMASGLPVITAKTTGAYAVLNDPEWTLDDPEDVSELARMVRSLTEDPILRRRLGEKNRSRALGHTWKCMASAYLDLYEKETSR